MAHLRRRRDRKRVTGVPNDFLISLLLRLDGNRFPEIAAWRFIKSAFVFVCLIVKPLLMLRKSTALRRQGSTLGNFIILYLMGNQVILHTYLCTESETKSFKKRGGLYPYTTVLFCMKNRYVIGDNKSVLLIAIGEPFKNHHDDSHALADSRDRHQIALKVVIDVSRDRFLN